MSDCNQMELAELMLSPEDSPARIFRSPGVKKGSQRNAPGFGLKSAELLATFDRDTHSWKTSQTCLQENEGLGFQQFFGTWSRSGMMRNGIAFQLPSLVCRTSETECGFLPTPQASDGTFFRIKRPIILRGNAYRITSNQGIDGNAKLADIAWNVWGGPLNPEYTEAMMQYPIRWTELKPAEIP